VIFKLIVISLLFFVNTKANTFSTSIGICNLEIYNGKIKNISEIVELIKFETDKLVKIFGIVNKNPYSVFITENMDEFNNKTKSYYPEWGVAIAKKNPDKIIIKAPGIANITYKKLKQIIIHELNHIYIFRLKYYNTIPGWFKEGFAMYTANEFSFSHKIEISKYIWSKSILPLNQLININKIPLQQVKLAYSESAAAVEALFFYYGNSILIDLVQNLNKTNFQKSFLLSSNDELIVFEKKYQEYLKNNYYWIILFSSPKYIYIILPIFLILGFIYIRYNNKKILKRWEIEELEE